MARQCCLPFEQSRPACRLHLRGQCGCRPRRGADGSAWIVRRQRLGRDHRRTGNAQVLQAGEASSGGQDHPTARSFTATRLRSAQDRDQRAPFCMLPRRAFRSREATGRLLRNRPQARARGRHQPRSRSRRIAPIFLLWMRRALWLGSIGFALEGSAPMSLHH